MAERLWSGDGCADNSAFEFVKHSDNGVALYRKVADGQVTLKQGGAVHIIKSGGGPQEADKMETITKAVAKALAASPNDNEKVAGQKQLIKAQLDEGTITVEKVAVEMTLESLAKTYRQKDPRLTDAQAYVKAMEDNPDLTAVLAG